MNGSKPSDRLFALARRQGRKAVPAMATTSIRVTRETHEKLKDIAAKEHRALGDVIDRLVDRYQQQELRRAVHESFRGLREDPAERESYLKDMAAWDVTLMDGLEDEPPYEDDEA
jgi:predicted CopG family antitoxin